MRLPIVFFVAGVVATIFLYLIDKSGKNTMLITVVLLGVAIILGVVAALQLPWIWEAESIIHKIWRAFFVSAIVIIIFGRFGVWIWPTSTVEPKQKQSTEKPILQTDQSTTALPPQPSKPTKKKETLRQPEDINPKTKQTESASVNRPAMQLLGDSMASDSSRRLSDSAFKYSAFLENSGTSPIKIVKICIGYGLKDDTSPRWADCHLNDFYLKIAEQLPLKWEAYWWRADEFMKALNTKECTFLLSVKFYNEKNEIVEKSRKLGGIDSKGEPFPIIYAGHTLN